MGILLIKCPYTTQADLSRQALSLTQIPSLHCQMYAIDIGPPKDEAAQCLVAL
jgi:hypothetical protein